MSKEIIAKKAAIVEEVFEKFSNTDFGAVGFTLVITAHLVIYQRWQIVKIAGTASAYIIAENAALVLTILFLCTFFAKCNASIGICNFPIRLKFFVRTNW